MMVAKDGDHQRQSGNVALPYLLFLAAENLFLPNKPAVSLLVDNCLCFGLSSITEYKKRYTPRAYLDTSLECTVPWACHSSASPMVS
jgi:hypothetical protein